MINRKNCTYRVSARMHVCAVLAISMVFFATPVQAGLSPITLEISAQSSLGTGTFQVTLAETNYDPGTSTWYWNSSSPINIMDGLTTIATIDEASFSYIQDPQVDFGFTVTAGAADTTFILTSGLLNFATLNPPSVAGFASAGLLLTDDGSGLANLTGLGLGGSAYLAQLNGLPPSGTSFANLLSSGLSVFTPNGTSADTGEFPTPPSFEPILFPVSGMSTQFNFELTANDSASGSSSFVVVPAPGALGLLMIGLICPRRRRRHSH